MNCIYGVGTDLVAVARIESALYQHGDRFLHRILDESEIADYAQSSQPARFLAKRFAVKEAFSKAFGTGIGEAVGWHDVRVCHDVRGKPSIALSEKLRERLASAGASHTHVSISDEALHALAFVVIERNQFPESPNRANHE